MPVRWEEGTETVDGVRDLVIAWTLCGSMDVSGFLVRHGGIQSVGGTGHP